ncbi:MAG: RuvX/YqgF family protein [Ignavibacteriaceae bacterium]
MEERFLGIDYGERRIGLALSDPLWTFAYSYKTLQNNRNLWEKISSIINEKNVTRVILGMPDIERNKQLVANILSFKKKLETKFNMQVITNYCNGIKLTFLLQ